MYMILLCSYCHTLTITADILHGLHRAYVWYTTHTHDALSLHVISYFHPLTVWLHPSSVFCNMYDTLLKMHDCANVEC